MIASGTDGARAATPRLHVVTDDDVVARADFLDVAERIAAVGPSVALHLRAPRMAGRTLHRLAVTLRAGMPDGSARLVINDRVDVALAAGADGVQLGARSLPPGRLPARAAGLAVGVSAHAPDEVVTAGRVDWWVVGTVFESASHPGRPPAGIGLVEACVRAADGPVIAIGGVTPERVAELVSAGAHGVAAIRGVWDADDPVAAVRRYLSAFDPDARPDRPSSP